MTMSFLTMKIITTGTSIQTRTLAMSMARGRKTLPMTIAMMVSRECTSYWRFQFAAPRGFAGAWIVLKDYVQTNSEYCPLFFTRLMAHIGTVPAKKDWLRVAGFAPLQIAKPGLVALGKCAVRLDTSADLLPPDKA